MLSILRLAFIAGYTIVLSILGGIALLLPNGEEKYLGLARHWSRAILAISGVRLSVRSTRKPDSAMGSIYVANHSSMYDIWILLACLPDSFRFIGKKELTKIPIFGWVWKHSGNVVIDRLNKAEYTKSLDAAGAVLKRGISIAIFPEGTRTPDGRLQSFKRGGFVLAVRAGAPIGPVTINGARSIVPKGRLRINPGPVEVIIGEPMSAAPEGDEREREVALMERAHKAVEATYVNQ